MTDTSSLINDLRNYMDEDADCTGENGLFRRAADEIERLQDLVSPAPVEPEADGMPCTCHPSDNPPVPCAKKYALSDCIAASAPAPNVVSGAVREAWPAGAKFKMGDSLRKPNGSWWAGKVVGFYSTEQTPVGYCVQMDVPTRKNIVMGMMPVQLYPEAALSQEPSPSAGEI